MFMALITPLLHLFLENTDSSIKDYILCKYSPLKAI
jgi:hypothetical protein